jgi:hypothetical protein
MGMPLVVLGKYNPLPPGRAVADYIRHTLMPPPGYTIAGVAGSCGKWIDGFQLIIIR